ncbi:MAG: hypothetical protein LBL26_14725 [Peptococcaceae bacterium]|jgi:hypothetical protein|nr:hypothetical protein [Peptococcaceae bacterium]
MLARVIRFYGGLPEDWLASPYLHFLAMWGQLHVIEKEEYQAMWSGMAVSYHEPKKLSALWKDDEKAGKAEKAGPGEPVPEEKSAKKRFYHSEAMKLMRIVNGGAR